MAKKKVAAGTIASKPDKATCYLEKGTLKTLKILAARHEIRVNDIIVKGIPLAVAAIERGA